ncbi:MAG TPA: M13 family metallopeptidase, partial [Aliidiomarina sp.]|nr:M13 family metallopeptidase [Aliidiomarina sp.]
GCSQDTNSNATAAVQQQQELVSGLYLEDFDRSVRPQDDLFMFVNGTWYENVEIPSDRPRFGAFDLLAQENERRMRTIIENAAEKKAEFGSNNQKIGDYYSSYMDEAHIEELGMKPVEGMLEQIKALKNHEELTHLMAKMSRNGVTIPFGFYAYADAKNPEYNALYLGQSGLGLPDRDYYFRDGEAFENNRQAYVVYIKDMLSAAGHPQAEEAANRIYALEKALAEHHWTRAESRDAEASYNKMTVAELDTLMGGFNYAAFAEQAGITAAEDVIVRAPSYFEGFGALFDDTTIETWKDYMQLRLMSSSASRLSSQFADIQFNFYSKTLNGIPEQQERWKRAVQATNGALGEVLGQEYVAEYFPPEAKARMEELIANLIVAFEGSIKDLDWMTPDTKEKALDKLSKFTPKVGYPNEWRDYSELEILPGDLFGNSVRVANFGYDLNIADIGQPVDRERWGMTPQTVNAYYSPVSNEIVFPAGILQPPFFNMDAEDAVNYGGIGAVIGHEIGHGFDDQGSRYDGNGNLRNWWTEQDREQFDARTGMLIEQYNQFEPLPGLHVDGQVSLGENIGDHVGLISAYRAYQQSLHGKTSPVMEGFTGEQRLFLSWAQIWKIKFRDDAMREQLARGPHAPGQYRAMGAPRNIPGFYEAFDVKPGDGMYVAPGERVVLW